MAKDSTSCCSVSCSSIQAQPIEKSLEEMNLKKSDFPDGFVFDDTSSGLQTNALDYKDGNQVAANDILAHGWQENYLVTYLKRSETQEIMGTKIILESYSVSLSKYDKAKDYVSYFKKTIENIQKASQDANEIVLSQKFGDGSDLAKYTDQFGFINYELYFSKNNIFVNFLAKGQPRQITDDKVIAYAKIIENRIGN